MKIEQFITTKKLVESFLRIMTNQAYANNHKFVYKMSWLKGTSKIDDGEGNIVEDYWTLKFYLIDKTDNITEKEVPLSITYYPTKSQPTLIFLELVALEELLLNGLRSLVNISYSIYVADKDKEVVKVNDVKVNENFVQIKKSANKPKLIINHDFRPNNKDNNKPDIIRG